MGTNNVSYFDKDASDYHNSTGSDWITWNAGKVYRNDGVDIFSDSTGAQKKYFVGNIFSGEWLQYSLHVAKKGLYTIHLKVSASQDGGKISLLCNNVKLPNLLNVPDSGGDSRWHNLIYKGLNLEKGKNVIRVKAANGGFNLQSIEFVIE